MAGRKNLGFKTVRGSVRAVAFDRIGYLANRLGISHGELISLLVMMYHEEELRLGWKKYGHRVSLYGKNVVKETECSDDTSEEGSGGE